MKYKKKPVEIEAVQLLDTNASIYEVTQFMSGKTDIGANSCRMAEDKWEEYVHICHERGGIFLKTLESDGETQKADFGDFIIKGVKGEFYPCKPDIFALTYDLATEEPVKKNDLDKMSIMCRENMDIRAGYTLISANKVKAGFHVTMGIDEETGFRLTKSMMGMGEEKYTPVLYVVNYDQFNSLK